MLDLDLAAFEVPTEAPWDAPDAAALDARTLATYLDDHLSSASARSILEVAIKAIFGTGSGELSLLFALFYLHAGGGLTNLARTTGGAQEGRFAGGSQQLAEGMAAELGDRVVLGAPVESVTYRPADVAIGARLVATGADPADPSSPHDPLRVRARRAVFAMSPVLCGRLTYTPPLPGGRDQLSQRMPMGAVTKVHVLYDRPFWREDGLNGQIVAPESAVWAARSTTPPRTPPTAPSSASSPATTAAASSAPGPRCGASSCWPTSSAPSGRGRAVRSRWSSSTGRPSPSPAAAPWP